jgi:5'-3' exonuclease
MGIKGLNKFLYSVMGQEHITIVPINKFACKKIAIDTSLYVYIFKLRNNYLESWMNFLIKLRENRIHPVFIFDGKCPPEKMREQARRSDVRKSHKKRLKLIEDDFEKYKTTGEISQELKDINNLKRSKLLTNTFNSEYVENYIEHLKSQIINISSYDFEIVKEMLDIFGIPHLTAESEGELYCSSLMKNGLVDIIMTKDTDALACLCPCVITSLSNDLFSIITLEIILKNLGFTENMWLDFCIMCGTDFNPNITKIGPHTAYELIKTYKSIDSIKSDTIDVSVLNHKRTREIFTTCDNLPNVIPYCNKLDSEKLKDFLTIHNINMTTQNILNRVIPTIKISP